MTDRFEELVPLPVKADAEAEAKAEAEAESNVLVMPSPVAPSPMHRGSSPPQQAAPPAATEAAAEVHVAIAVDEDEGEEETDTASKEAASLVSPNAKSARRAKRALGDVTNSVLSPKVGGARAQKFYSFRLGLQLPLPTRPLLASACFHLPPIRRPPPAPGCQVRQLLQRRLRGRDPGTVLPHNAPT